jgi:hypothetical protein
VYSCVGKARILLIFCSLVYVILYLAIEIVSLKLVVQPCVCVYGVQRGDNAVFVVASDELKQAGVGRVLLDYYTKTVGFPC